MEYCIFIQYSTRRALMLLGEKLQILGESAKFDVSCASSGSERGGRRGSLGSTMPSGICHTFTSDGRCISLLKVLMTNICIHDCQYCVNRVNAFISGFISSGSIIHPTCLQFPSRMKNLSRVFHCCVSTAFIRPIGF